MTIPPRCVASFGLAMMLGACGNASAQTRTDGATGPGAGSSMRQRQLVQTLNGLPRWSGQRFSADETAAVVAIAEQLSAYPVDAVRTAFDSFLRGRETQVQRSDAEFKLYMLMRIYFRMPPQDTLDKGVVFGGFLRPSLGVVGRPREFWASWPVVLDGEEVVGIEPALGYSGSPWKMLDEFDYLHEQYGLRYQPTPAGTDSRQRRQPGGKIAPTPSSAVAPQ